ncbi:FCD domain-containing protein, partial [Paenibacillus polymyxa]|nr:FCD domain-containing protein [Paenibacillus polymyxa]
MRQVAEMPDVGPLVAELGTLHAAIVAAMGRQDARGFISASRDFYLAAARYTGNAPLTSMLSKLYEQIEPLRYMLA